MAHVNEGHPEAPLVLLYIVDAGGGHSAAANALIAAAAQRDVEVRILENAATFLGFNRPEEAEPLYRRAAAMEPANSEWRKRIAQTLTKRAEWADDPEERRRHARAAVEELEIALTLSHEDWIALVLGVVLFVPYADFPAIALSAIWILVAAMR